MVLDREHFDMILAGTKALEVRCQCLRTGLWHVGHHGVIYGVVTLGAGWQVHTEEEW